MSGLKSLQVEIYNGIPLSPCKVNADLKMYYDRPNGCHRFTFVKTENNIIKSFATFVIVEPINDILTLSLGYAVPENFRGLGLAAEIVEKSIRELQAEFTGKGVSSFYIESVVGVKNIASQKISSRLLTSECEEIIDSVSGEKAYYYLRQVLVSNYYKY